MKIRIKTGFWEEDNIGFLRARFMKIIIFFFLISFTNTAGNIYRLMNAPSINYLNSTLLIINALPCLFFLLVATSLSKYEKQKKEDQTQ